MPIEEIDKKRPICDTDIWIKSCKHKEIYQEELIFDVYDKIFMSDAVRQELGRIRESKEPFNGFASIKTIKNIDVNSDYEDEYKKDFELGLRYFSEENGKKAYLSTIKDSSTNEILAHYVSDNLRLDIVLNLIAVLAFEI